MTDRRDKSEDDACRDAGSPLEPRAHKIRLGNREITLPRSRLLRMSLGAALIFGGILGFLPIVGFWMLPLGLLVLSYDLPVVRRWRRRFVVWWYRQREKRARDADS